MDTDDLTLSEDAYNAYMLRRVMEATTPPGETEADARNRCAAIVEMFRKLAPNGAVECMMACHRISLEFLLHTVMREAANTALPHKELNRSRAMAMSISRTLHLWTTKFESVQARDGARAAETRKAEAQSQQSEPPAPVRQPAKEPRPTAPAAPNLATRLEPPMASSPIPNGPMIPPAPARISSMEETLLASAALLQGMYPNGYKGEPPDP
jgi:hypothetical protein